GLVRLGTGMSAETSPMESARTISWPSRLMRSRAFAWSISIVLHGLLFVIFYEMGFARAADPRRVIIPEARLAAGPAPAITRPDVPVKLTEAPRGTPSAVRAPHLDELPIISVDLPDVDAVASSGPPSLA